MINSNENSINSKEKMNTYKCACHSMHKDVVQVLNRKLTLTKLKNSRQFFFKSVLTNA